MIDYHHKKADKILHHTYPSFHNQSTLKVLNLQFKTELSCNWTIVTGELNLTLAVESFRTEKQNECSLYNSSKAIKAGR